jgi:hypothetical protein
MGLVFVLGVGLIGFFVFSYMREVQMAIAAGLAIAYFVWGVMHHYIHKDLTVSVILEYVLFAILGYVILTSLILRY